MSSSASCAISGSGKRGVRAFRHRPAGRNDPRSVARRPLPRLRHRTGRGVLRHLKRPAAPKCASAPLFRRPPALRRQLLTSGPTFVTLRPWKCTLWLQTPGQRPGGPKAISYQSIEVHAPGGIATGGVSVPGRPRSTMATGCDRRRRDGWWADAMSLPALTAHPLADAAAWSGHGRRTPASSPTAGASQRLRHARFAARSGAARRTSSSSPRTGSTTATRWPRSTAASTSSARSRWR